MDKKDSTFARRRKGCVPGCLMGLAVFAILAVLGWYVLMGQAAAPKTTTFKIDLARLRSMAEAESGRLPIRLNAAVVGEGSYPQVLVIAGAGLQSRKMVFDAFQLVYEDSSLVIDATLPAAEYRKMFPEWMPGAKYSPQQYKRIQQALEKSSLVLLTHAHIDHIAGLTFSPNAAALMPKLRLSQEQIEDAAAGVGMTEELRGLVKPLDYQDYYSPAPGVVLMKSPGHSKGDQLIYVRLQNGGEFLLTGDVVWSNANITQATGRPLLFRKLVQEDWEKNGGEIRALHDLAENQPIHMLVSHDGPQMEEYIRQGIIGDGFE